MQENKYTLPIRVCYLNITPSDFSRSGVHTEALRLRGVEVLPCIDASPGVRKFLEIFKKHRALHGKYDALVVGYPAYILVPFARLISRKPVIFDAGWSLYEGTVVARGLYTQQPLQRFYYWCIDWLAYKCAHLVLLESNQQVAYYQRLLHVSATKLRRLFTGASGTQFYPDPSIKKREVFTVVFRGYANPEAGLQHVVSVARALEHEGVQFLIISPNAHLKDLPANIELHEGFFSVEELRSWMQSCHVSIGQVSTNERLERTIPHKAFESMLLGIPFLTADAPGVREIFSEESALLVHPGSETDIIEKIKEIKDDPERGAKIANAAYERYIEKCSNEVLADELIGHVRSVLD